MYYFSGPRVPKLTFRSLWFLVKCTEKRNIATSFHEDQNRMEVLTDAFSGEKQVQFQSILGFWQRKQCIL